MDTIGQDIRFAVHMLVRSPRFAAVVVLLLALAAMGVFTRDRVGISSRFASAAPEPAEWPVYGGDIHGTRYSPLAEIDRHNVAGLRAAWTYHTGETGPAFTSRETPRHATTPIVVDGLLYGSTPLGRVFALDAESGEERWAFDAGVDLSWNYGDFTSRGAATWVDPAARADAPCRRRIYIGTIDARLIALDAAGGTPCVDFGDRGTIDLRGGLRVRPFEFAAYQVTSPPLVVNGLVITGSAIADNSRLAPASGEVRAFDARTGALRWSWDPIPQDPADPAHATWAEGSPGRTGSANVWSVMVADPERDLVFAPTSSPAPDYYGALRLGSNRYANSIVALRASTGEVVWHFQTVHHDLWDYDNASPPALVELERDGRPIPALLQATKTGELFVLHRETGEPLVPVTERTVPASDVPGEQAWPTQPFSAIGPLSPHRITADDAWGITPEDREICRALIAELRNEGIYTPPSLRGTLVIPSNIGGAHWGGLAFDTERQLAIIPVNRHASMVQLIPVQGFDRDSARAESERMGLGYEYNVMVGTPYAMRRRVLRAPSGLPCTPPPHGALVAIDLKTAGRAWEVPLGEPGAGTGTAPVPLPTGLGSVHVGGPIVTAGGLVFMAGATDGFLRAFDVDTGRELWRGALPARGRATPATYRVRDDGRQYVVVSADGARSGGYIVAFCALC